jgi:hypothetical protein
MRKIIFPLMVALVASFLFMSCTKEVTDEDIINNIIKNQNYTGTDSDGDAFTAVFTSASMVVSYTDFAFTLSGAWTVTNSKLIVTNSDATWTNGVVTNDGANISITANDGTDTYSLVMQKK